PAYTKEVLLRNENVTDDSRFLDIKNTLDPVVGLSNPNTIFRNYLNLLQDIDVKEADGVMTISSLINSSNRGQLDTLLVNVEREIRKSRYADDLLDVKYSFEKDVLYNDEELALKAIDIIASVYGEDSSVPLYGVTPCYYGDDFAYFQEKVRGVYFFLGGSDYEKGIVSMPHSPDFAADEECIRTGVNYFSSMMVERLKD